MITAFYRSFGALFGDSPRTEDTLKVISTGIVYTFLKLKLVHWFCAVCVSEVLSAKGGAIVNVRC